MSKSAKITIYYAAENTHDVDYLVATLDMVLALGTVNFAISSELGSE